MTDFFLLMKSELSLILLIIFLLVYKIRKNGTDYSSLINWMNFLLLLNFASGWIFNSEGQLFNGMFRNTTLLSFEKNILNLATWIIVLQSTDWLKKHQHVPEFFVLLLSSLLGMFYMLSSGNILMFYLSLELSTIPLAAMVNFDLEKKQSGEAAMKMILSSAFSSCLLLFGISILYGTTGTLRFDEIPAKLDGNSLQIISFILIFTGFAFKLSVVPFHLWTADVYEGAPVAVTSFLSVVSKASMLFVTVSVLYTVFRPLAMAWYNVVVACSILTMIIGNLFALRQDNLKRFLAFSSIAQVGFILIGISGSSQSGMASSIYFMVIYVFSNLGAFGVVSLISARTGKEYLDDYKGLYQTNPRLSWLLAISLFSLAGIPPTAGFFGKLFLLTAGAGTGNYVLIGIAALNMVIALAYYLRIIRAVFMDPNPMPLERFNSPGWNKTAFILCVAGMLVIGFAGEVFTYIHSLSFGM